MAVITSIQNQRVKQIAALKEKKARYDSGLFVVEGVNMLKDLVDLEPVEVYSVEGADTSGYDTTVVTREVMKRMSDTVTPQGLLAVFPIPDVSVREPLGNSLILDGVSDPGNLGTIIRTAVATGFLDIYLNDCADPFQGKTVRSTMGAIFRVRLHIGSREDTVRALGLKSAKVYYLDMAGDNLFDKDFDGLTALVVGSEAHGVGEYYRNHADGLRLPMREGIESLNAAVSASVAMYRVFHYKNFGG